MTPMTRTQKAKRVVTKATRPARTGRRRSGRRRRNGMARRDRTPWQSRSPKRNSRHRQRRRMSPRRRRRQRRRSPGGRGARSRRRKGGAIQREDMASSKGKQWRHRVVMVLSIKKRCDSEDSKGPRATWNSGLRNASLLIYRLGRPIRASICANGYHLMPFPFAIH